MKRVFFPIALLMIAFIAEARQKPAVIFVDDEFNPWFGESLQKLGLIDNSRSTGPLPSKMDMIDPNSTEYRPTELVFKTTRPEGHAYPTKNVIRRVFKIPEKWKRYPTILT